MTNNLSIALAQINPIVGDIDGNIELIKNAREEANVNGADLLIAGELTVSGYPPEDLVLKPVFMDCIEEKVTALAAETSDDGPALIIGTPWRQNDKLFNAVMLLDKGEIVTIRYKNLLPTYGVFDEDRVFESGPMPGPVSFKGVRLGVMICEDMWEPDVTECLDESGAEILIVINGSPFEIDKSDKRLNLAVARVTETGLPLVYVNLVGGQDELVFDGGSFVLNADRQLQVQMPAFTDGVFTSKWTKLDKGWSCQQGNIERVSDTKEKNLVSIYQAMVLGLRDYVNKNRFPGIILGLSGGVDSGLSAAVAVDAIGSDKVHCVMMPSPYTSKESIEDAAEQANLLGITFDTISIVNAMNAFDTMLQPVFGNTEEDTTEENIQARTRGLIVMAISNKLGYMPLTTGNKSEMSVGYATLYGDMCGGFSVLKDVYKTTVFAISKWRNKNFINGFMGPQGMAIPSRVINKKPSAELRPDQFDEDSLPPYDILDGILISLIERESAVDDVVANGYDPDMVKRVWNMLDGAEYKRRQAPPGVKISSRAFGRDRRYPITNGFTNFMWKN